MTRVTVMCPRCHARVEATVTPDAPDSVALEHRCPGFTQIDRQKMVFHALDLGTEPWGALACEF